MSAFSRHEISERLLGYFQEANPRRRDLLNAQTDLLAEVFVDSFGVVETLLFIERSFGVDLLESGVSPEAFKSVDALAGVVAQALADRSAPPT